MNRDCFEHMGVVGAFIFSTACVWKWCWSVIVVRKEIENGILLRGGCGKAGKLTKPCTSREFDTLLNFEQPSDTCWAMIYVRATAILSVRE